MKKILIILTVLAAVMLTSSCQKELPDAVKNIDVSQGGQTPNPTQVEKYVRASAESLSFTSPAGSLSFTISSNTSWSIKSDQDWCMVSSSSGSGNATLTVNVSENTSTSSRSATITISSTDAGSVKVSITQAGANPDLQLNKNDLSFTADAGSDSFTITSNTSWTITSNQDWCTVSTSSGSNNATVTVNVTENTSTSSRGAMITVKAGDRNEISHAIAITQAGAKSEAPIANQVVGSYTGTEALTVMGEVDESTKTFEFTKATDVSVDVTLPQSGEGMMTVPALPVKGIALTRSGNSITGKLNKYVGTVKSADDSEKAYTVSDVTVIFNDKTVVVTFTQKYGNMPFAFEGLFTGTKEK